MDTIQNVGNFLPNHCLWHRLHTLYTVYSTLSLYCNKLIINNTIRSYIAIPWTLPDTYVARGSWGRVTVEKEEKRE